MQNWKRKTPQVRLTRGPLFDYNFKVSADQPANYAACGRAGPGQHRVNPLLIACGTVTDENFNTFQI